MKCTLSSKNIKTFYRAIITLSKIGDELYLLLEKEKQSLTIKSVNGTKCAYGSFTFLPEFLSEFDNRNVRGRPQNDSNNACQVSMKSILPCFKWIQSEDKQIDSLEIVLIDNEEQSKLRLIFHRKANVVRQFSLNTMEFQPVVVSHSRREAKSFAYCNGLLLHDALELFPTTTGEVSLNFDMGLFSIMKYEFVEPSEDQNPSDQPKAKDRIGIKIDVEEFSAYSLATETSLICCLKEVKGVVWFTATSASSPDAMGLGGPTGTDIKLHFTEAGRPLILYFDSEREYEATFVIATIDLPRSQAPRPTGNQWSGQIARVSARQQVAGVDVGSAMLSGGGSTAPTRHVQQRLNFDSTNGSSKRLSNGPVVADQEEERRSVENLQRLSLFASNGIHSMRTQVVQDIVAERSDDEDYGADDEDD